MLRTRPHRAHARPPKHLHAAAVVCAVAVGAALGACAAPTPAPPATVAEPLVVEATIPPPPSRPATVAPAPAADPAPLKASAKRMLADSAAIEEFGIRPPGSKEEAGAAAYVADRMRQMGYEVSIEKFKTPDGTSRNVISRLQGADPRRLVLGAHLDSLWSTPGANDDAAGCAVLLEIARITAEEGSPVSIEFVFFGSEEYNKKPPKDHHRGSRYRVSKMSKAERRETVGMISVDVVAWGPRLYSRTMGIGPKTMSDYLLERADDLDIKMSYLQDPGPTGWSDHEPYEKAGIPAAWIERLQDPQYHKAGDTTAHLQSSALAESARLVLSAVRHMDSSVIDRIRPD